MIRLVSKLAIKLSRLLKNDGTSIGGKVAYTLDKDILRKLSKDYETIIVVTGTNGKTTVSNLIASCFEQPVTNNSKGANMYFGVVSAFIQKKSKIAVLEVDEGSIHKVFKDIKVDYFIVMNFFRDQLDRYGEIDILVDQIKNSIQPNTKMILNANDPFCFRLSNNNTKFFGLSSDIDFSTNFSISESKFCPNCKKEFVYKKNFYLQIGYYYCSCGFNHPKLDYCVEQINESSIVINSNELHHNLIGNYNSFNIAACYSLCKEIGIDPVIGLSKYISDDGRMQVFEKNVLTLVKNPSGMNMSIMQISNKYKNIVFILNDNVLDGKDVSWIWDADFELLTNNYNFFCCGTRKYDMAVRLKLANINKENINIIKNLDDSIDNIISNPTFVISSYTSIHDTKKMFEKRFK